MTKHDLSKFPPALIAELKKTGKLGMECKILSIFQPPNEAMGVDDIIINMFERYDIVCKRKTLFTHLSNLYRSGLIKRLSTGVYALEGEGENG